MDWLKTLLIVLLVSGVGSCSCPQFSVPVKNLTVGPGDNVTLYCDCKVSMGVYITWFKNCSHETQPTLVLDINDITRNKLVSNRQMFPRFVFVKNNLSDSYDLLIMNITESDEGLYYCGTTKMGVKDGQRTAFANIYKYSKTSTRLLISASGPRSDAQSPAQVCSVCWKLLFSVCPILFALSTFLSFLTIYLRCHKTDKTTQDDEGKHESLTALKIEEVNEDVCYAALEIHRTSQRIKRKRTIQSPDYATYAAINKSKVKGNSNFK